MWFCKWNRSTKSCHFHCHCCYTTNLHPFHACLLACQCMQGAISVRDLVQWQKWMRRVCWVQCNSAHSATCPVLCQGHTFTFVIYTTQTTINTDYAMTSQIQRSALLCYEAFWKVMRLYTIVRQMQLQMLKSIAWIYTPTHSHDSWLRLLYFSKLENRKTTVKLVQGCSTLVLSDSNRAAEEKRPL